MKPLVSLISEAKAEVVETVEDIDDSQKIKVGQKSEVKVIDQRSSSTCQFP